MHLSLWWNSIFGNQCRDEFPLIFVHYYYPGCIWALGWSYNVLAQPGIQTSMHFPHSCLGIVWCSKYTGFSVVGIVCFMRSQYPRSSSCKEKTSLLLWTRLMNQLCWSQINLASFLMFNWKGSLSNSFSKLNSAEFVSGQGSNSGLSILGLSGWMGPASIWQLLMSIRWGGTAWKPTKVLLPSWFIFGLHSISSHSAWNNSAANKGVWSIHYTCWCL